jgi:hypothetical protein
MNIDGQNTLACTKSMHDARRRRESQLLPHQPVVGPGLACNYGTTPRSSRG